MPITPDTPLRSALSTQIGKASTLVEEVTARITSDIARGVVKPGGRLPTEKEMMLSMGVSRTVIREAIAQLRARGLVNTRQGLGAYVSEDSMVRPLQISVDGSDTLRDTIHLVELRVAIEVESAALAAMNAGPDELHRIDLARVEVEKAIHGEAFGVAEDFAFHRQIAVATGNPHFPRILDFLGQFMIPRTRVHFAEDARVAYENLIIDEHQQIFSAIARGNPVEARNSVRQHVEGARLRYAEVSADFQFRG